MAAGAPEVVDGLGRAVRLPAVVARVVSLAPSSTEIVYALGAGARVVGVDRYSNFPAAVAAVEKVGNDTEPSLERIVALHPDLVLTATSANSRATTEALQHVGIAVYVSSPNRLEDVYADVARIGLALGRGDEGTRLAAELRARVARVEARVGAAPRTRAAVVVWSEPLILAGKGSHVDDMVRAAGGDNVAGDSAQPYPTFSVERLIARAPEVLVTGVYADGKNSAEALARHLPMLPAVRDHRVHTVDGDLLFRPGPRVVEGIERLAALLHP